MVGSFDAMEIWCVRQQVPDDPGVGRVGNSLVFSAGPQLHRHVDIGEADGIESESQTGRCGDRGGDAWIMAQHGRWFVL